MTSPGPGHVVQNRIQPLRKSLVPIAGGSGYYVTCKRSSHGRSQREGCIKASNGALWLFMKEHVRWADLSEGHEITKHVAGSIFVGTLNFGSTVGCRLQMVKGCKE